MLSELGRQCFDLKKDGDYELRLYAAEVESDVLNPWIPEPIGSNPDRKPIPKLHPVISFSLTGFRGFKVGQLWPTVKNAQEAEGAAARYRAIRPTLADIGGAVPDLPDVKDVRIKKPIPLDRRESHPLAHPAAPGQTVGWAYLPANEEIRRLVVFLLRVFEYGGTRGWTLEATDPAYGRLEEVLRRGALYLDYLATNQPPAIPTSVETPPDEPDAEPRHQGQPSEDRQADILAAIKNRGVPLTRPELIEAMGLEKEGKLGHHLSWMVREKKLVSIPQRGYWPADQPVPK